VDEVKQKEITTLEGEVANKKRDFEKLDHSHKQIDL